MTVKCKYLTNKNILKQKKQGKLGHKDPPLPFPAGTQISGLGG